MSASAIDELVAETRAERTRLVHLLGRLTPEQWRQPSLCAGWQVREVVAHITMPYRTTLPRVAVGLTRARFSFDRYADRDAHAAAASRTDAALLGLMHDNIDHPWRPPGGGQVGALSHDVIHGLDITEPLGLPRPPTGRVARVLGGATPQSVRYFGVDLHGTRLVADDADVSIGEGVEVRLPVTDLLLVVCGRRSLADATHPS